jgi:hypothetical protein
MLNDNCNNEDLIVEAHRLVSHFDDIGDYDNARTLSLLLERFIDYRDLVDETHILLDTVNKYEMDEDWNGLFNEEDIEDEDEEDE